MKMLKEFLLVGAGGALGSMLRYTGNLLQQGRSFPLATLVINILGSLVIGMVMGWCLRSETSANWKLFLATGICGGFTTFSAFSFENVQMLQNGKIFLSLLYISGSVVFGIAAAWLGYKIIN